MTTTVTVTTHDWPVAVDAQNNHQYATDHLVSHGFSSTQTFVPPHSEMQFTVTDTQTVTVRELAKDATKLFDHDAQEASAGNQAIGHVGAVKAEIADAGLSVEG